MNRIFYLILFSLLFISGCGIKYTYNSKEFDSSAEALESQAIMYEKIIPEIGTAPKKFPEKLFVVLPRREEVESRGIIWRGNPDPIQKKYISDSLEADYAWMAKIVGKHSLFSAVDVRVDRFPESDTGYVLFVDFDQDSGSWVLATTDMMEKRIIRFDATARTPLSRVKSWLSNLETEAEELSSYMTTSDEQELDLTHVVKDSSPQKNTIEENVEPQTGVGNWDISMSTNPLDDTKTVVLTLLAKAGAAGNSGQKIPLIIRCKSGQTDLYVSWGEYLGSSTMVTTRVGRGKMTTSEWSMSTESTVSFFPNNAIPFIKKIMKVDQLVLKTTPYQETPIIAVYETQGLSSAIKPLRSVCRW